MFERTDNGLQVPSSSPSNWWPYVESIWFSPPNVSMPYYGVLSLRLCVCQIWWVAFTLAYGSWFLHKPLYLELLYGYLKLISWIFMIWTIGLPADSSFYMGLVIFQVFLLHHLWWKFLSIEVECLRRLPSLETLVNSKSWSWNLFSEILNLFVFKGFPSLQGSLEMHSQ